MPEDLFEEPERRAAEKILSAERLASQGKLREALDALNLAIQLAPSNPESFQRRAEVFERMGLAPQAEADRLRAADLAAARPAPPQPPPPEPELGAASEAEEAEVGEAEHESAAAPAHEPADRASPGHDYVVAEPRAIPREMGRGPGVGVGLFVAFVGVLFLLGIAGGMVFAAGSIDWGALNPLGGDSFKGPSASPFATGSAAGVSATATSEPTVAPNASTKGDPFSLSNLETAWKGKGMTVQAGAASQGFSGFKTAPVDVTLTKGGASSSLSVLVYKTREAALDEWNLIPGSRPEPKGNRKVPNAVSLWWNANLVVVLRSDAAALGPDALDGLLSLGG